MMLITKCSLSALSIKILSSAANHKQIYLQELYSIFQGFSLFASFFYHKDKRKQQDTFKVLQFLSGPGIIKFRL
jgi:uncharacterized membrane protein (GlpM family)